MEKRIPVLGVILGDPAGSSYELVAKVLLAKKEAYTAVLFGSRELFERSCKVVEGAEAIRLIDWKGESRPDYVEDPLAAYIYDIPAEGEIPYSTVTAASGRLQFAEIDESIKKEKAGLIDGILMSPITKAAFHEAGYEYLTEFELFADLYGVESVGSVIRTDTYFRSTVVGHCAFKDIYAKITTPALEKVLHRLIDTMEYFMDKSEMKIAVAALNPHAGENGLFGDEETTILKPAIDAVCAEGYDIIGPWPCDTAIVRLKKGQANGIVFLYHDQGNIAQKASDFGNLRLIYVGFPGIILPVSHGPAYGKAGKGTADPGNMIASMETLYQMACKRLEKAGR